ncbi:auxin-induced protein IAA6 [Sesamum indicum]|uniref:Auxin-responsive protein n=2 Tax=Sesamum indicum TaxID=4182 RepID=A0A6I9SXE2_SESIN|nr:auxin-induced protein IAA6 [Sesamum indicum]
MDRSSGLGLETELRLGLPGGGEVEKNEKKRAFSDISGGEEKAAAAAGAGNNKNQVVGWPPVCAYRRKNSFNGVKMYVKVSMDGAPFLRKIDLSSHKGYSDLLMALEQLFGCFGIAEALEDADKCEYVPIYEDKDTDWMLLGDVPWEMFIESCKRLRIMKRSDAKGAKDLLKALAAKEDYSSLLN